MFLEYSLRTISNNYSLIRIKRKTLIRIKRSRENVHWLESKEKYYLVFFKDQKSENVLWLGSREKHWLTIQFRIGIFIRLMKTIWLYKCYFYNFFFHPTLFPRVLLNFENTSIHYWKILLVVESKILKLFIKFFFDKIFYFIGRQNDKNYRKQKHTNKKIGIKTSITTFHCTISTFVLRNLFLNTFFLYESMVNTP